MVNTIIILRGLPGSGKSTWAKEQVGYKCIANDDLRVMLYNDVWSPKDEKFMLKMRDALIVAALQAGQNVIVDATHLNPKHEIRIRDLIKDFDVEVIIKDFTDVSVDECIARDLKRPRSVGEEVIREMYNRYLKPSPPVIKYNMDLPDCIICDLDGTIALNDWRNPYDATECEKDLPNIPVMNILRAYKGWLRNTKVIFLSGREDKYREQTQAWLNVQFHDWPDKPLELHMRQTRDMRKDFVVKQELYEANVKDKYNVVFVLDDRLSVCRMWYNLGLPLLRVGNPDSNF